jgi:hypothetical protein
VCRAGGLAATVLAFPASGAAAGSSAHRSRLPGCGGIADGSSRLQLQVVVAAVTT